MFESEGVPTQKEKMMRTTFENQLGHFLAWEGSGLTNKGYYIYRDSERAPVLVVVGESDRETASGGQGEAAESERPLSSGKKKEEKASVLVKTKLPSDTQKHLMSNVRIYFPSR